MRYLGIPTIRDRVVQMALKLLLEPIFETDFYPSSYGYRPVERYRYRGARILLPWMEPMELGVVGRPPEPTTTTPVSRARWTRCSQSHDRGCLWKAGCAATCTSGLAGGGSVRNFVCKQLVVNGCCMKQQSPTATA